MDISTLKQKYIFELQLNYNEEEAHILFWECAESIIGIPKIELQIGDREGMEIESQHEKQLVSHLEKLKKGIPLQYVLGVTDFYGFNFKVNESVLIPRPETEELVEWIVQDCENRESLRILDIGTGSGVIPIVLEKKLKDAQLEAVDISNEALDVAKENAHRLEANVNFISDNFLLYDTDKYQKEYDLLVSNPPYIRKLDYVQENVSEYEPNQALYVEEDPLIFYRQIIAFANSFLKEEGRIYVEINQFLGPETKELFELSFKEVELKKDLSGNDRMIKAIKGLNK